VNISIIVLHTNTRGRLINYEFYNILNVIYVISVKDKLEPQNNDWSQYIFGSFRVNKRPLRNIKFVVKIWLKPTLMYLYVRSFFRILTKSFDSYTTKKKAVTFYEIERTVIDTFFSQFTAHGDLYSAVYVVLKMKHSPKNCDKHGKFSSRAPIVAKI
jgi:hypothetical protein